MNSLKNLYRIHRNLDFVKKFRQNLSLAVLIALVLKKSVYVRYITGREYHTQERVWRLFIHTFFFKHRYFQTSLGWCLTSNWFCSNFHHTPTPVYMLKMHIIAYKCIIVRNEFTNKLLQNTSEHQFCQKKIRRNLRLAVLIKEKACIRPIWSRNYRKKYL